MANEPFILCDNLVKIYKVADLEVVALQGLDLEVAQGEMIALVGSSGSGKSTLLNVIGSLDNPAQGKSPLAADDLLKISNKERVNYKREVVGFVWQQTARNLLPYLTAAQNVALPMQLGGSGKAPSRRERNERAPELLIARHADAPARAPHQFSGGQQQRVAIAVALANSPPCSSPTNPPASWTRPPASRSSPPSAAPTRRLGTTIVIVTHDQAVACE